MFAVAYGQRVRAGRAREVVEAQAQHDGAADPPGRPHPARDAVDEPDERRVELGERRRPAAERALRADRPAAAPRLHRPRDRGCAPARGGAGRRRGPSSATSAVSPSCATSPTVVIPRSCSLLAVTGPTPHSRSTGSGWRNASSPSGGTTSRPSGLATPLATLARNFVRATPTVIGSPTRSRTSRRSRAAISVGVPETRCSPRTSRNASSIDMPLDERRRVVEDPEHGLARLGVGRHARRDDDRLRAETARAPAAHRGADAERLGLVAGGEHDPAADDHRPAAQPRIVALLDRGEERVEVGVQDRRLARTYVRTGQPSSRVIAGSQRRKPPRKAFVFAPRRTFSGSSESFFAFPPPSTT